MNKVLSKRDVAKARSASSCEAGGARRSSLRL